MGTHSLVLIGYSVVNLVLAVVILIRSPKNSLSRFYVFCVVSLEALGLVSELLVQPGAQPYQNVVLEVGAFTYALFPFFFLHFVLLFIKRYEVLQSKTILLVTYLTGLGCYTLVLLDLIPMPFLPGKGMTAVGNIYYLTWMSILFAVGVALLYSLIGGFSERGLKGNALFFAFVLVMLLLPSPFTLTIFSAFMRDAFPLFFVSSTISLIVVVYFVFRHRIMMNTPYQAMRTALQALNDIIIKTDLDFKIEMATGGVLPQLGYSVNELVGLDLAQILRQKDYLQEYRNFALSDKMREAFFDCDVLCKDGTLLPFDFSFTPVMAGEALVGFVGVGRNVADRREAEVLGNAFFQISQATNQALDLDHLLKELQSIVKTVINAESLYIVLANESGNDFSMSYGSDSSSVHLGLSSHEALDHEVMRARKSLVRSGGIVSQAGARHPSTLVKSDFVWVGVPLFVDGKAVGVMGVNKNPDPNWDRARDVRMLEFVSSEVAKAIERKRTEDALKKSEEKHRKFFKESLAGHVHTTPDGTIIACNSAFASIFGFSSLADAKRGNIRVLYRSNDAYNVMLEQLKLRKKLKHHESKMRCVDGKEVHIIQNVVGSFDNRGELTEIMTYMSDHTEWKRLEVQFYQAQKMENLGSLAGGIAHDFNNILAIVSLHTELLQRDILDRDRRVRSVEAINNAARRGTGLVSQLLTFARKKEPLLERVELNRIVEDVVAMLKPTFPKTVDVQLDLAKDIPSISADTNQISQILLNLCVNAKDAMPNGGTIRFKTNLVPGDEVRSLFVEASKETEYVCLEMSDTGSGMDESVRSRIFEPFFTTKEPGKGTGLGLSVVYGVVKGHRGFIDVHSTVGLGTTFVVYLPCRENAPESDRPAHEEERENVGGSETILLVEDEEDILLAVKDILQESGYKVLTARDGEEAVEVFERNKEEIALLLSDLGLPKLSGLDAYVQMAIFDPGLKAILASGNLDVGKKSEMLRAGVKKFVQKPYEAEAILRSVREVIREN